MAVQTWSAHDPGHPERSWLRRTPWQQLPSLDVEALTQRYDHVLVCSAHPDDETLAFGGVVAELAMRGVGMTFVCLSAGEASHPEGLGLTREGLARIRQAEYRSAIECLLGAPPTTNLIERSIPDGRFDEFESAITQHLDSAISGLAGRVTPDRLLVLAPDVADGHIDHDVLGHVTRRVARDRGAHCVTAFIWRWHWAEDMPWTDMVMAAPSIDALSRRDAALELYHSQTTPTALPADQAAVLPPAALARGHRLVEFLHDPDRALPRGRCPSTPPGDFDAMFRTTDDPWQVETSWYEKRRQSIVEAMLPSERFRRVLDLGCSTGRLTQALAARAEQVVAVDSSAEALRRARQRNLPNVEWREGTLPAALAGREALDDGLSGTFDLAVLSEVGYFLSAPDLMQALAGIDVCTDGVLVSVHWRHPTENIPLNGPLVTRAVADLWPVLARYDDDDVSVVVCRVGPNA